MARGSGRKWSPRVARAAAAAWALVAGWTLAEEPGVADLRLPAPGLLRSASSLPAMRLPATPARPEVHAPLADLARSRDLPLHRGSGELPGASVDWRAGLGLQLDPGTRVGIRRANGGTQIVLRSQF